MLRLVLVGPLLAIVCAGCGSLPATDAGTDASARSFDASLDGELPDAGAIASAGLEVGEGESMLAPIADGQTLLLARGCQGSQHVWISLRADASLDPRGMTVRLDLFRARDDLRVSLEFLVRLSFQPDATGSSSSLLGLTLQVPMPDIAIGEDLRLEAQITDRAGTTRTVTHTVRVAWGTEVCGGMGG
ncbi:MAG: hypothetical protein J0L92_29790 [Deltaproteobacteria bacterium]|nr:hypothetical protein [Deltaproteobacteria bacterium]